MSNWESISRLVNFTTKGITPSYVDHSSITVLNQKCIRNNKIDYSFSQYTDDTKNIPSDKFVKKGDILVNSTGTGTAGRCAFVSKTPENYRLITDSHILILRCSSFYEAQCLNYILYSFEEKLMSFMTGSSGQSELDKVVLLGLKTKMTKNPKDQRKIASVLSALDAKIELNNKINAELETMAKTLYDYWFVQFDFSNAKGKPYKTSGGKMVWNQELKREIPENWEVKKLGDLGSFKNGVNYDPSNPGRIACPIINVRNISASSYFIKNSDLDIIYLRENDLRKYSVHQGNIIIARSGIPGATRLISNVEENTLYCGFAIRYELVNLLNKLSIFLYLKSIEEMIKKGSGGTILKNVNQATLNNLVIAFPDEEIIISKFNKLIEPLFDKINLIEQENQQLATLRDFLLPMLMNGQVVIV